MERPGHNGTAGSGGLWHLLAASRRAVSHFCVDPAVYRLTSLSVYVLTACLSF
jgi:hypothetical protein